MRVLITGSSCGVGRAAAVEFLAHGFEVIGIDKKDSTIDDEKYIHYKADVRDAHCLPDYDVDYILNNAGIVTPQAEAIDVNCIGYINILEKYGNSPSLKAILQIGSTASFKGYDNIRYCASQGARDALTKWAANHFGNDPRHVIVNSLNLDGIVPFNEETGTPGTSLEPELYEHPELLEEIKNLSVLKQLTTVTQIAQWIYFLLVTNNSMTGQILSIDGELTGAYKFIKYPGWDK